MPSPLQRQALNCLLGREKGREKEEGSVLYAVDLPAPILSSPFFFWAPKPKLSQGYVQRHLLSTLMWDAMVRAGKGNLENQREAG